MAFDDDDEEEHECRPSFGFLMDQFECVDAFIEDQDAYNNAMVSLQNSNVSTYSKIDSSTDGDDASKNPFYEDGI